MIKISRLADYGTVILSHLASVPGQRLSANQLAQALSLPAPTVSKLLKKMNEALLVTSVRGANGGYQLACPAKNISIAQIITAIDGPLAMTDCSKDIQSCLRSNLCDLRHNWQYINQVIISMLCQLSLSEMNRPLSKIFEFKSLDGYSHDK